MFSAFPVSSRIQSAAANIAKGQPALVGLQEVLQFQCVDLVQPPPAGLGCSDPSIAAAFSDHLLLTLDALDGTYVEAATVVNLNIPVLPFNVNGIDALLGVVDRDVILARSDIDATPVDYTAFQGLGICLKPSADGCNYSLVLQPRYRAAR